MGRPVISKTKGGSPSWDRLDARDTKPKLTLSFSFHLHKPDGRRIPKKKLKKKINGSPVIATPTMWNRYPCQGNATCRGSRGEDWTVVIFMLANLKLDRQQSKLLCSSYSSLFIFYLISSRIPERPDGPGSEIENPSFAMFHICT